MPTILTLHGKKSTRKPCGTRPLRHKEVRLEPRRSRATNFHRDQRRQFFGDGRKDLICCHRLFGEGVLGRRRLKAGRGGQSEGGDTNFAQGI